MSQEKFKKLLSEGQLLCPECNSAIKRYDKYVETSAIWDGAGDSQTDSEGSKVTLICGNDPCKWEERTEYWDNYLKD